MRRGLFLVAALLAILTVAVIALSSAPVLRKSTSAYEATPPIAIDRLPLEINDLTWTELRALVRGGRTTAIIPTAGTEQNGPHVILGKHSYIVRHTAERIAKQLGNALVAPVIDYVPEGSIDPPTGHMTFDGTISIPESVFAAILESAARSLRAHGFTAICFLGDSGGNQAAQAAVAKKLNAEWADSGTIVLNVSDYYSRNGQVDWLLMEGETQASIGSHAGIRDTSELLAVFPDGVRADRRRPSTEPGMAGSGVNGDPTRATADRGKKMLDLKVEAAVRQIRRALEAKKKK